MVRRVLLILTLLACSSAVFACGTERWAVKVLTDSDHTKIRGAAHPLPKTVTALCSVSSPTQAHVRAADDSRFAAVETRVVTVKCRGLWGVVAARAKMAIT
jgi:hypothetical protein